MIHLYNGHNLEYVVASGPALGFDGRGRPHERPLIALGLIKPELFTVITKTLTRQPREGNFKWRKPWESVRLIPGGAVNKINMTNPGIEWWREKIGPRVNSKKVPIIVSLFGTRHDLVQMVCMLNKFDIVGFEINVSCPNTDRPLEEAAEIIETVKMVYRHSMHPVIVKVSVEQEYLAISQGLVKVAQGIDLNSVKWETVFPGEKSPLLSEDEYKFGYSGGGVSGRPAQAHNWEAVLKLSTQGSLPVIGPSIMAFDDLEKVRNLGADAVSFGAIHLRTPWRPTNIVSKDMNLRHGAGTPVVAR